MRCSLTFSRVGGASSHERHAGALRDERRWKPASAARAANPLAKLMQTTLDTGEQSCGCSSHSIVFQRLLPLMSRIMAVRSKPKQNRESTEKYYCVRLFRHTGSPIAPSDADRSNPSVVFLKLCRALGQDPWHPPHSASVLLLGSSQPDI
jgi:hypothetical protein